MSGATTMQVIGEVRETKCDLMRLIRARRLELGIPGCVLAELAGLPDRYVSKLEAGMKTPGRLSLPLLLQSLGLKLVIVADDSALPAVVRPHVGTLKDRQIHVAA